MQIITINIVPIGITGVLEIQVLTTLGNEKYIPYFLITEASVDFWIDMIYIPIAGIAATLVNVTHIHDIFAIVFFLNHMDRYCFLQKN